MLYILSGGGYGGSAQGDGLTNGCSTIGISKSQPVEVLEQRYPVLFEEYSLHEGSGGAGQFRGGFGINYRLRLLRGSARASMVMDHGRFGPKGAQGGADGGVNKVLVLHADGRRYVPPHLSKDSGHPARRRRRGGGLDAGRRRLRRPGQARPAPDRAGSGARLLHGRGRRAPVRRRGLTRQPASRQRVFSGPSSSTTPAAAS